MQLPPPPPPLSPLCMKPWSRNLEVQSVSSYIVPLDFASSGTGSDVEFHAVAQQLLAILHKAVETRVVRAPPVDVSKKTLESASIPHKRESTEEENTVKQSTTGALATPPAATGGNVIEGNARVAVLYSGGVDSAVLAALTDRLRVFTVVEIELSFML